jgi:tripartite ATP-independent transporter DctM subunit
MDPALLSVLVAVGIVLVLLIFGIPIGVCLGIGGMAGIYVFTGGRLEPSMGTLYIEVIDITTMYGFIVIPMFMLMGNFSAQAGIARDLFDAAYRWVGRVPGGLSVSTVVTCAGMAAITGSSVATAAAMTKIALPELRRFRYRESLAVGTITVGGTLAIMIPPSITFVLYGIFAEQSIGKLLIAGIFPGFIIGGLYAVQVIGRCIVNPKLGPQGPKFTWGERIRSLIGVVPFLMILFAIMAGILLGVWTPVEASAAGVSAVFVFGIVRRRFSFNRVTAALVEAVLASTSVMVLIIGAMTFSCFLAMCGYSEVITNSIIGLGLPPFGFFMVIVVLYVFLGMFLEATSILALTVPLLIPALKPVGWDPIWFGVICVSLMEVAAVTPPVGLNIYAVKAAAQEVDTSTIYWGCIPFWFCNIIAIIIIYFFPKIALYLPGLM